MELPPRTFDRSRDHWWWRPGWGPGSRYLTFHLTFEGATALHAAAAQVAHRLHGSASVDLVPVPCLHLTMTGLGFTADVDERAIDAVTTRVFARASAVETEPLRFDRAFLHSDGFGIETRPATWLDGLQRIQAEAVSAVRDVQHDYAFEPHVSLAYFSGDVDLTRVEGALRSLPDEDVVVEHPRLSLLELGRDDRMYTWRVIHQLTLG